MLNTLLGTIGESIALAPTSVDYLVVAGGGGGQGGNIGAGAGAGG